MRFTHFQQVLFINGYTFVHLAPTEERLRQAVSDFQDAIASTGSWSRTFNRFTNDRTQTSVVFKPGVFDGAASEHVSVLFMDGKRDEYTNPKVYDEALAIPAERDGMGPMVVR